MKITIPNSAFIGNIESFIRKINTDNEKILSISFNKNWISVHPVVLSTVAALGLLCNKRGIPINVEKIEAISGHYLQRMGLLEYINSEQKFPVIEHEPAGRFIPLTRINDSQELSEFIKDMIPLLHASPQQVEPIKYAMSELIRNVLEHSVSCTGAIVCAQYFKKSNRVAIGIADCGIGVKGSMDHAWKTDDHAQAIKLALMPGITGTTNKKGGTEQNAGAGLFFTKSIAKVSGDYFMIYSGDTLYKLQRTTPDAQLSLFPDPMLDRSSIRSEMPYWKGTCVGIDFSMDVNQEFGRLLDLIRDAYFDNIKDKTKRELKKPSFI
jgi:anti-sigma regulatory factor (Ser/Thr protein kinase)